MKNINFTISGREAAKGVRKPTIQQGSVFRDKRNDYNRQKSKQIQIED
jgi:hypothetical protein